VSATKPEQHAARLPGLDWARGAALVAMALYHFAWDLELFDYLAQGTANSGGLKLFARSIATSFLFITGASLVLATRSGIDARAFSIRLLKISGAAGLITLATWQVMPEGLIFFGILHHIALASLLGLMFLRAPLAIVVIAALVSVALPHVWPWPTQRFWLAFIGLFAASPQSNDFVPVFPWFGAVLAGIAFMRWRLAEAFTARLAVQPANIVSRGLCWLGRRSLAFYLLHQPILLGGLWLFAQIMPPTAAPLAESPAFKAECMASCQLNFDEIACQRYCACFIEALSQGRLTRTDIEAASPALVETVKMCSAQMN
jgi:uncharacterized membrane protein